MMRGYVVERWESKRNRGVCKLWRKVGLEPGTGRHEEPVQLPEAMVISRPGMLPRVIHGSTAAEVCDDICGLVATKSHLNVNGLGAA